VLIRNATVLDGAGRRLDGADVLLREGKVAAEIQDAPAGERADRRAEVAADLERGGRQRLGAGGARREQRKGGGEGE
jgi:hypothetical protein